MIWKRAVFALFAVAAGTNVPAPLLLIYQERLDLSAEVLTALFGCYAAGLVPALLLAGPLSDRLGRRRVAIPGIVLSGLASLAFAAAGDSLTLLFAARFLQGVVSGVVFSVGSAWVGELSQASGEGAGGRRAAFAMTAGFSLGPLTGGLLGQYAPAPTVLPYLLHTLLVAVGLAFALRLPETVDLQRDRPTGAVAPPASPLIRPGDGLLVATVLAPVAVCVYAFPSTMISAVPLLVDLPYGGVAVTGVLAGVTLGAGTVVAGLQRRLGPWTAVVGTALGTLGFGSAAAFAATGSLPWLIAAAPLLGAGGGLCLAAGLTLTARLAAPARLGALTSLFLALAYVGFAAPFVTAVAARATSATLPLTVAAVLAAALAIRLLPAARARRL
ncbi:MFS transporter [Blastococcus saxobsidens]|uniref:Major Facilitator Superfamily transporter (Modular protein) n=1 Tax=Blastococcus saxobsidens (strain DD2) TaxID=1146883 RepID=H6RWU7_BLASD|nr:MFS transporter [Blastococcus saxobsidens]CCG02159.1 Major Facilitator Superfamily transporter (modular protein) [Blastococcus saxobsidens DD2]